MIFLLIGVGYSSDITEDILPQDLRMNNVNNQSAHPEPFDSPFVLSLSKDERLTQDMPVEGRLHGSTRSPRTVVVLCTCPSYLYTPSLPPSLFLSFPILYGEAIIQTFTHSMNGRMPATDNYLLIGIEINCLIRLAS